MLYTGIIRLGRESKQIILIHIHRIQNFINGNVSQFGCQGYVPVINRCAPLEGSMGAGSFQDHQIGAVPIDTHARGQVGDGEQVAPGIAHLVHNAAGRVDLCGERFFLCVPLIPERLRIGVKRDVPTAAPPFK